MPKKAKTKKGQKASRGPSSQDLLKALGHPLRIKILTILNERTASPNELARALDEGLSQVSYHVKVLRGFECIEMIKTAPRRGAVEHFYRARHEAFVSNSLLKKMPKSAKYALVNSKLKEIDEDLTASLQEETFYGTSGRNPVVRRLQTNLDGRGCKDAEKLIDEFVKRYAKIGAESKARERNGTSESEARPVSAVVLSFDSALDKGGKKRRGRQSS